MANLRDVRLRMRAIRQTLQVTKAMKLISTAKLRKGRRSLQDVEPYFSRIQKAMFDVLSGTRQANNKFLTAPGNEETKRTAILAITSDKGLAGGYNANIFRQVHKLCETVKNPVLILVGTVGYRYFLHSPLLIMENFSFKSRLPELDEAKMIADYLISQYLQGMFGEVHIVYTHMYSSIKLLPREQQLLPLNKEKMQKEFERSGGKRTELPFEYWPSREDVLNSLVPMYMKGVIYGSLVEAYASEQSARMSAMDEASKSAEDMLASLQIHYNRARQAGITQEMTEIVGGAEALGN
ncbi:MAG: ATP synthase F1 subunit gamma [Treponema sp.]|jgi:F-type H+-transporting ATPase subunit gamma|nr:ATP synthase F1 subunit gamma [Treponema sp.]